MLYSLRAVRADRDRRQDRRPEGDSFWARYSSVLRVVAEQPGVLSHLQIDGARR